MQHDQDECLEFKVPRFHAVCGFGASILICGWLVWRAQSWPSQFYVVAGIAAVFAVYFSKALVQGSCIRFDDKGISFPGIPGMIPWPEVKSIKLLRSRVVLSALDGTVQNQALGAERGIKFGAAMIVGGFWAGSGLVFGAPYTIEVEFFSTGKFRKGLSRIYWRESIYGIDFRCIDSLHIEEWIAEINLVAQACERPNR
jgi:hypothetical protein